ncbi:EAL domain-containing protein [Rheinheimera sp. 4Y26]|uniref:EAL domain-containing response regulator n=1 Tax=Rheinheimera sp. 4Y26 TaxID=2977811 RepID=UPI0021B09D97|nr:EAL domain-containing response regulator [Rheinheimera sp. 4Y26]MCT6699385.1 EAL domain-containing response regulator [Rheinheimera sp. 4Y26]
MNTFSILVVEDSPSQREYMRQLCSAAGVLDISEAANGHIALEMLQKCDRQFDLIICDLEMPDMDGIELLHQLASMDLDSAIAIVSSREANLIASVELMAKADGLNVIGSMAKPVMLADLQRLLQNSVIPCKKAVSQQKHAPLEFEQLQRALLEHQFELHYQPKLNMRTLELAGVEALVRLRHPERGLVYPNDFIQSCERYNLIDALSYEVLVMAIAQLQLWQQQGFSSKISVNLSATSFDNKQFLQQVTQLLANSGITPSNLIFEVTETAVIRNMGQALAFLTRLRLLGFGLSIDDYGTGYSSVKQLSQIPFTELKIDRSLIDGIHNKAHLQVIFESTLLMCDKLGINLVAEGVETAADWRYLQQANCMMAQGYYLAKPMSDSDFIFWVTQGCKAAGELA